MDAGAEVAVELALAGEVIAWTLAGAALGTISGLVPELHTNNFALLAVGMAPLWLRARRVHLMGILIGPLMLCP